MRQYSFTFSKVINDLLPKSKRKSNLKQLIFALTKGMRKIHQETAIYRFQDWDNELIYLPGYVKQVELMLYHQFGDSDQNTREGIRIVNYKRHYPLFFAYSGTNKMIRVKDDLNPTFAYADDEHGENVLGVDFRNFDVIIPTWPSEPEARKLFAGVVMERVNRLKRVGLNYYVLDANGNGFDNFSNELKDIEIKS